MIRVLEFHVTERNTDEWEFVSPLKNSLAGPTLPVSIYGSRPMVYHPSGGVIAITPGASTIYYLAHAAAAWVALPQTIKTPRAWTTAFLVPDNLTSCATTPPPTTTTTTTATTTTTTTTTTKTTAIESPFANMGESSNIYVLLDFL